MQTIGSHQGYWDIWGCGNNEDDMEEQEQQAHLEDQTGVLSAFDPFGEHTSWNEAKGAE